MAETDDIERPFFSETSADVSGQSYDLAKVSDQESSIQIDENITSQTTYGVASNERFQTDCYVNQGDSLILDVVSETADSQQVSQTLKRASVSSRPVEEAKHVRKGYTASDLPSFGGKGRAHFSAIKAKSVGALRSSLNLEVIAGPAYGVCCSRLSTNTSMLPVIIGRVLPSNFVVKDSEVSGKHALINWNVNKSKWEIVDMGSLNGTFLNSRAIHHQDSNFRHWSDPIEIRNGDIITLGTSSKILVHISQHAEHRTPFGVGVASDPMAMRRGGKQLPMEDMCYYQCPLPDVEQFGLFGIFDGHGGAAAAETACKMLPQNIADILSKTEKREKVVALCNASDVLREAFHLTEAAMNHQYEGCTATVLLVWIDHHEELFAQCANVGDSACVVNVSGKQITMTEDHRIIGVTERARFSKMGMPLKDGEARVGGINLGRMLGDKFLKEQDSRFSAEPYVSQAVHVSKSCREAFALLASDGLWDVISIKKAVQLIVQKKDAHDANSAVRLANYVLGEARNLRTKDNTTIIFLDFDSMRTNLCNIHS
ncbi:uncharacterized protein A4U43_C02F13340 [Asparagus officinalis]|uniref:protein-serine/threonine phosphatase n=1 Tax=Asparagus officinalis TaxID=4686 RepID=A0A5P1FI60_ASPOF|nr:uncharacterized protein A4U43_C02F13340 [Asparagus officinalis]